jgi:hypothetical protein
MEVPMLSRTVTAVLDAPRDEVFAFLSDVDNLPLWATEFARELRHDGDRTVVVNGLGEFVFSIEADDETGVIDMYADGALFPTRVVPLDADRSAYTFTMFKSPHAPDELFDSRFRSLLREFDNIRNRFGARP